jgi:undecaprenyl-diphosphatase
VEKKYQRNIKEGAIQPLQTLTVKQSLLLGCYQALSILPGVSRSGAIIIGGLFHTMERKAVAQFAFLLAVPTMSIATAYSLLKNREILLEQSFTLPLFVGFLTSFVIAMMVITFLLNYIKKHSFVVFGWYRIFLGILIIGVFL